MKFKNVSQLFRSAHFNKVKTLATSVEHHLHYAMNILISLLSFPLSYHLCILLRLFELMFFPYYDYYHHYYVITIIVITMIISVLLK